MNQYSAYPLKRGLGWWAMIRVCRESHPSPVMERGAKPKIFASRGEAAEECLRHVVAFLNGHEIRGERFDGRSTYRDEVDRVFFQPRQSDERKAVGA